MVSGGGTGSAGRRCRTSTNRSTLTDALYPITRHGAAEDAWFDLNFSPVRDDDAAVVGVLATVVETTHQVLNRRRLGLLNRLATPGSGTVTRRAVLESVVAALAVDVPDVPFAIAAVGGARGDRGTGPRDRPVAVLPGCVRRRDRRGTGPRGGVPVRHGGGPRPRPAC